MIKTEVGEPVSREDLSTEEKLQATVLVDCEQSLSFLHNQSNFEVRAAILQAKTV